MSRSTARPASQPKEVRPYHVGDLRAKLIAAGLDLVRSEGERELSLRRVARAAGVTHTAAYRHFDDRDALIAAMAEEGYRKFYEYQSERLEHAGEDFGERFRRLGYAYISFTIENPEYARLMFGRGGIDFKAYPALVAAATRTFRRLQHVIRLGQRVGLIQGGRGKEKTLAAWSMVHGLAMLILDGQISLRGGADDPATEALITSVIGFVYTGMG